jgi:GntR family transcriptional regulator, rspAB operon transcriptional repressor
MIPITERTPSVIELDPIVSPPAALPDRIYATLKHRILTCAMLPGERIVEKDLCKEMQVSRTPLREAFNRLSLEGLIVLSPYRGYAVAPVTVNGYRELCELRRIVEGGTAARAAEMATPADVARMTETAETRYTPGDRESYLSYLRKNSAFHLTVVQATKNRQLEGILMSALDRHQRPLYLGLDIGIDGSASTEEHLEITEAVNSHEPEKARKLMVKHIAKAEDRIVAALRAAGY